VIVLDRCSRCGCELYESRIFCYTCTAEIGKEEPIVGKVVVDFDGVRIAVPPFVAEREKLEPPESLPKLFCPLCDGRMRDVRGVFYCRHCGFTDSIT
jgi:hypothetical protein